MKVKIVNRKRFVRNTGILLGVIIFSVILFIGTKVLSYKECKTKTVYISEGENLWKIAKQEQDKNEFYQNKDIRYIVEDIKITNKLKTNDVYVNQKLLIHCN